MYLYTNLKRPTDHSVRNEKRRKSRTSKVDFLGLKTLTKAIQKAVKIIQASKCPDFNIETIDLEQKSL